MPELPEIEIIKLGLQKKIIGLKIQKIQVISAKSLIGNPNIAEGKKVLKVERFAKMLGLELDGDITLLFHLKMSGQIIWEGDNKFVGGHPTEDMLGEMPNKHTRVIFSFSDGSHMYFNDQRKFGWIKVIENFKFQISNFKFLNDLGSEPLEKDFTWQVLRQNLLKHPKMPVKVAIMDQSVVSGVGNIYANEACFIAKIDPRKKVSVLTDKEFQALHIGIVESLQTAIKHGGSTRMNFVDPEGNKGRFLDYAYVYNRAGQSCKVCRTSIKKVSLGGRGAYFCPSCQKNV